MSHPSTGEFSSGASNGVLVRLIYTSVPLPSQGARDRWG